MSQLKSMLIGVLLALIIVLTVALALLVVNEVQPAQAQEINRPVIAVEEVQYARLVDAIPQRDITVQQFAPLK